MSRRFTLLEAKARPQAPEPGFESPVVLDRRAAIALLSAGMAAALSACGKPHEEIVPYVQQPTGLTPGEPQRYATALTIGGYARGVSAVAIDGRPIKIEGLAGHPYSLGSTDVFAEAAVLSLYDPARAKAVSGPFGPSSWDALEGALLPRLARAKDRKGAGLTLLTTRIVSPTELRLISTLQQAYPQMRWRRVEAIDDDAARAGARMAFGRPLQSLPRLEEADVVLCLDADPLGAGPEQIRNGRGFAAGRKTDRKRLSRWYAAEGGWSLTGANADHRMALHPTQVQDLARVVASGLGAPGAMVDLPDDAWRFARACAADLKSAHGRAVVLVGRAQPPEVQALAHWMNARLQAPVTLIEPLDPNPEDHRAALAGLVADLKGGAVETLVVLGGNPAYDAPAALDLPDAIRRAPFSLHCTIQDNYTSALCQWRAALTHPLESWGDARAPDGTASIVQPLIHPLHDGRAAAEVLAMLAGAEAPSAYTLVRQTWSPRAPVPPGLLDQASGPDLTPSGQSPLAPRGEAPSGQIPGDLAPASLAAVDRKAAAQTAGKAATTSAGLVFGAATDPIEAAQATAALSGQPFDLAWKQMLTQGVIDGTAAPAVSAPSPALPGPAFPLPVTARPAQTSGFVLALAPDPTLYDGAYAENAWLQECAKPLSSEVWGASLAISPQDARTLGVGDFDHLTLSAKGRSVTAPVRIATGQATGVISGFTGGGRTAAGPVGTGVGQDFGPLRDPASPWLTGVTVAKAPGHGGPPSFQGRYKLEGEADKLSPVVRADDLLRLASHPVQTATDLRPPSLLPPNPADDPRHEPAWAMVIDQSVCIGCNACVISCQAENNVPVVGPEEVARGRDMHWLRIDTYDTGGAHESRPSFQPVPCMQCEHAPCEPVCPVEASVHDHEGLNDQVYNRCIGTRFCESNCPYKVRRFNWYGYAHDQAYANLGDDAYDAVKNPDVTVRARGVMEKCTYCVQRISGARRTAEKEGRDIAAHAVVTACQSSCPTQAISFGDLNNPGDDVADLRSDPRHFALLAETGARPRTTYLARVRNPNPALEGGEGAA
jgi:molybdopterin-containing oxidoreductase family iron-sulfur binding subunit